MLKMERKVLLNVFVGEKDLVKKVEESQDGEMMVAVELKKEVIIKMEEVTVSMSTADDTYISLLEEAPCGEESADVKTDLKWEPHPTSDVADQFMEEALEISLKIESEEKQENTEEKPFKCLESPKTCSHPPGLNQHCLIHTRENSFNKYNCKFCPESFTSKPFFQMHTLKEHSEEEHHLIHSEDRTFECLQCPKYFNTKYNLKQHLLIHTGEKPFKCLQCPKSFTESSNLKQHLLIHTGEKTFKYLQCPKAYNLAVSLKIHLLTHTGEKPFKCLQCSKSFSLSGNLKQHLLIHTGEKPFKCLQCLKCFNTSSTLKTHLPIHTGEKPFKCVQCPISFKRSSELKSHLIIHTEILQMADCLNLPQMIPDRANTLFKQVHETKSMKGKSVDAISSACLYIACRQEAVPRTFKEICVVSKVSKKDIGKCFKQIVRTLKTSMELIKSGDFISRFCSNLGLPQNVQKACIHIATKAVDLDLVPGRSPISVSAASIYMACSVSKDKKTQKEIGDIAGVAEVTIKQAYKLMLPRAKDLFPDSFEFNTPIEYLPSS
jgi:transcription initiation factor TFIIB